MKKIIVKIKKSDVELSDRTIRTVGDAIIILDGGVIFENPFGSTILIEAVEYNKAKNRSCMVTYILTKGLTTERFKVKFGEFIKGKQFYYKMKVAPLSFTSWICKK